MCLSESQAVNATQPGSGSPAMSKGAIGYSGPAFPPPFGRSSMNKLGEWRFQVPADDGAHAVSALSSGATSSEGVTGGQMPGTTPSQV